MRCNLIVLFIFFSLVNCEKEKVKIKKGQIEIEELYIKYKPEEFNFNRSYIIESIDDSEIYNYKRLLDSNFKLPFGPYKLVYSTFYKQENKVDFTVDSKNNKVVFYSDSLDYSQIKDTKCCLLVDALKENEILNLYFNTSGCYLSFNTKLELFKKESEYYINTNYYKNKKLNANQVRRLREFEFEVYNLDLSDYYCTTTENYLFLYSTNNEFVSATNSSCWYYGYSYFIKSLEE